MRFLVDFLRPGDLFVDVGANVGVYSLLACSVPGVEVWAFEPSNEAFAHALENVRINHLGDRLHVVRAAVSKRAGRGFLTIGLDTVNRLDHTRSHPNEAVEVVELDSYLADTREDLTKLSAMKVDVEGSEPDVLAGAFRLLDDASPVLVIERNKPEELREMLSPRGYVPFDYDPLTGTFDVADWIEGTSPNLLLSKDFDHMAARFGAPPHHEVT
ncbi:MAG TPA: FkbM family methyltransferase [Acidimicrobiales bacterium]|nr:FkbM family methyltransferase [Acidimicrobiales bacterium]